MLFRLFHVTKAVGGGLEVSFLEIGPNWQNLFETWSQEVEAEMYNEGGEDHDSFVTEVLCFKLREAIDGGDLNCEQWILDNASPRQRDVLLDFHS